ncbi:MAG TPA: group 1 truncated hemoglobin [Candidatus Aquilonibacter sp.]
MQLGAASIRYEVLQECKAYVESRSFLIVTRRSPVQAPKDPTLYERLGGAYRIAILVDDFVDRIMSDSRLEANPRVKEANARMSKPGFKYIVTEMTCWATGGPQTYTGREMGESHKHLMITEAEWESFMDDFQQALDQCNVRAPEQRELIALLESSKRAIVVA